MNYSNLTIRKRVVKNMDKTTKQRQKVIASYASTNNLDVGFAQQPNLFLGITDGLDLKLPKEKAKNYNHIFINSSLIPSEKYDSVTAGEVIEHVFNIDQFIKEIHRVLKPNGLFILSTPNPHYFGDLLEDWLNLKISSGTIRKVSDI